MSQEARVRAAIDEAVARATAPLEERLEAVEARLRAVEGGGGATPTASAKRPSTGRTARAKGPGDVQAGERTSAGQ